MGKQFVALLGCGIQAHRVVHSIVRTEWHFLVAAIDARTAGVDQMLHRVVTASFENVVETNHVGLDVRVGVLNAIAYSRLRGKVDNNIKVALGKKIINKSFIGNVAFDELIFVLRM